MNNGLETRYFLSALTGAGYYALHRQFLRPPSAQTENQPRPLS